jgi:hypothetical protein
MLVHESQIEDILATYPWIAKSTLQSADEVRLIVRQMPVPSGRLDMLFAKGSSLLLVELKAETAIEDFVWQIKRYEADLIELQAKGEIISAQIQLVLLAPAFSSSATRLCAEQGVVAMAYSPQAVLDEFFKQLTPLQQFLHLRPKDYGLWNWYLTHRVLYALEATGAPQEISDLTGLAPRSVMNHLRFTADLHLVQGSGRAYVLTELGRRYVAARTADMPPSEVSEAQLGVLRDYIAKNPFSSPVFLGIYSAVEAVFTLARNTYPVTDDVMLDFFKKTVGKLNDWKVERSARQGMKMYSNYAVELGLLGRFGQELYLTPDGLRFILLLNLHKSIQMVDALGQR